MAYRLRSELTEKQIEADVASYLGLITPPGEDRFRLLDVNESLTGADKRFDLVIPLYMQFKVSQGLTAFSSAHLGKLISPILPPLQRIRLFRKQWELFDSPTLYFKLRDRSATAIDFQHNMLLRLSGTANSQAFYVAPLTLLDDEYNKMLQVSRPDHVPMPFSFATNEIWRNRWYSTIGFVPFLRGHISIVPDEVVDTSNHYYAFSTTGTEISWHSPRIYDLPATRLSDRLRTLFYSYLPNRYNWIQINVLVDQLNADFQLSKLMPNGGNDNNLRINELMGFGRKLYSEYGIRQFLILSNDDLLERWSKV